MVPTIFLPIVRVRLAPLPRTLQAGLLIHQIRGDLLPMIVGAALSLAYGLVANLLLRMITIRLKDLPTVAATAMVHQAAPEENERNSFSLEAPLRQEQWDRRVWGVSYTPRLCGVFLSTESADHTAENLDRRLLGGAAPRNNTLGITANMLSKA